MWQDSVSQLSLGMPQLATRTGALLEATGVVTLCLSILLHLCTLLLDMLCPAEAVPLQHGRRRMPVHFRHQKEWATKEG